MCDQSDQTDLIDFDHNQSKSMTFMSISTDLPETRSHSHLFQTLSPISLLSPSSISLSRINRHNTYAFTPKSSVTRITTHNIDEQQLNEPLIEKQCDETEQHLRAQSSSDNHEDRDELADKVIQLLERTNTALSNDYIDENSCIVSNSAPLDCVEDVLKTTSHSNTSTNGSCSSSDGINENKSINKKLTKCSNKSNRLQKIQSKPNDLKSDASVEQSISSDRNPLSPKKSKHHLPEEVTERASTRHERQFKHLVERQKNYLKCLQRELVRLEKMEKLFAKLHTNSKHRHQTNQSYDSSEHNRETTTSIFSLSTNSGKSNIHSKCSSECCSSQSDSRSTYLETTDTLLSSKSSYKSSNHNSGRNTHHTNYCKYYENLAHSQLMNGHSNINITNPKQITQKPVKISKSSKAIQTSQSLLDFDKTNTIAKNQNDLLMPETDDKQPISWFIPITKKQKSNRNLAKIQSDRLSQNSETSRVNKRETVSLQEAFNRNCNVVKIKSQRRINHINSNAEFRKNTAEQRMLELIREYERDRLAEKVIRINSIKSTLGLSARRIFTHKQMREHTERIYVNLPEVRAVKERKKREEKEKNQRVLSQIYKYKLKNCALKGKVNWPLTHSCLYY